MPCHEAQKRVHGVAVGRPWLGYVLSSCAHRHDRPQVCQGPRPARHHPRDGNEHGHLIHGKAEHQPSWLPADGLEDDRDGTWTEQANGACADPGALREYLRGRTCGDGVVKAPACASVAPRLKCKDRSQVKFGCALLHVYSMRGPAARKRVIIGRITIGREAFTRSILALKGQLIS
eukprot:5028727-Prymnesium_polylepis.2